MLGQIITKYYGVKFSQMGFAVNLSLAIKIININRRQRHWERVSVISKLYVGKVPEKGCIIIYIYLILIVIYRIILAD